MESSAETGRLDPLPPGELPGDLARAIAHALRGLEFGSVEITVHHARVVQIERHERIRLSTQPAAERVTRIQSGATP